MPIHAQILELFRALKKYGRRHWNIGSQHQLDSVLTHTEPHFGVVVPKRSFLSEREQPPLQELVSVCRKAGFLLEDNLAAAEGGEMALLDTHYYGGIKKYQWVSLPLALHGVFVRPDGKKITLTIGEAPGDPVFTITDLLPHLANDQMKKTMSEAVEGEGLDVLVGSVPSKDKKAKEKIKHRVLELLKERYGVVEADFVSSELEFVPAGPPREEEADLDVEDYATPPPRPPPSRRR